MCVCVCVCVCVFMCACVCVGVDVIVATPGKILQLEQSGEVSLGNVSYLVLDEADRFLQGHMEEEIRKVI